MNLSLKVEGELLEPDFDLTDELEQIAERIVIPDIVAGMGSSTDISDLPYAPLASSTIKRKLKLGLNTSTLIATGQLISSLRHQVLGKNKVEVFLGGIRSSFHGEDVISNDALGDILQNQGVRTKSGKRYFEFFGKSKRSEDRAIKFLEEKIKEEIENARKETIR